jgi:hypothetical protein
MLKLTCACDAAAYAAFPVSLASMTQLPALVTVTAPVLELTVQALDEVE